MHEITGPFHSRRHWQTFTTWPAGPKQKSSETHESSDHKGPVCVSRRVNGSAHPSLNFFIPRPRLSPSALSSSSFMSSRQAARHGKHIDPVRSIHFSRPNQLLFKLNQAPRRHVLATLCKPPTSIHPAANQSSTLVNSLSAAPPLHPSKISILIQLNLIQLTLI